MSMLDTVTSNRSYRRFYQDFQIETETLSNLVNLGRLSASGMNLQPLKYIISNNTVKNEGIFNQLGWAAYLKDWPGPIEGERPSAYIIILGDKHISSSFMVDHGIAAQSILLGAAELGLGGCMIATIRKRELADALSIDTERFEILLAVALGKPKERVVIDPLGEDGSIRYWRDEQGVHHVPKRDLKDIIVG